MWFATHQNADGSIPASPDLGGELLLYRLQRLLDRDGLRLRAVDGRPHARRAGLAVPPDASSTSWYASQDRRRRTARQRSPSRRLLVHPPRRAPTVAYYNAGYVRALRMARPARGSGSARPTARPTGEARIARIAGTFSDSFWDPAVGAFRDTTTGPTIHATGRQPRSRSSPASPHRHRHNAHSRTSSRRALPYGNPLVDSDLWNSEDWGSYATERVYPFIGHFELLARYSARPRRTPPSS